MISLTKRRTFLFLLCVFAFQYCSEPVTNYSEYVVQEDPIEVVQKAKEIRDNTPVTVAEDMEVTLWATDRLAPDPIAMSIDDYGRVYLTRTNRQKNSEFDIRSHRNWITESISLQSVEDRRVFLKETFSRDKSKENEWLPDLNDDGVHDWRDLAVEKDEVWRIEDLNKDGVADISTRVIRDFNEEVTDVAGALLVRRNDIFVGVGPDMWRITDQNNDGILDTRVSISHGYAVHIGFSGHGMSGAVEGPDGKIYWGIGDIGAVITTKEGATHKYPNQGVLVRANPDGSDFEVFAAGLRNVHEFAFDEYGNIIGADNDGDHRGEHERILYIVEGHDAGWRTNWQFGKYDDPRNNQYKVWMDEKLHLPRWDGQAAYILPPLFNYHNGPTGMIYNPGTALSSKWRNKFFLVEFVGNPARSPIWAFSLKPDGASFAFEEEEKVFEGILPTGIRFGPDGALYAADWINGWGTKNYGRVWKLDVKLSENDLIPERVKTRSLMTDDYTSKKEKELYELLFYPDMRIRRKAQFELADRGKTSLSVFEKAIVQTANQLARIHGIWGTGQLIRMQGSSPEDLIKWLDDQDQEIVAQTAKVLGEVRYQEAGVHLTPLLTSDNDRVKFFAAQALGRIKHQEAIPALIKLLEANADEDLYLRHAAVLALSRIGAGDQMAALSSSPDRSLRVAAVLTLRRLKDPRIAAFLNDPDPYIVTETARAINDDFSIEEALPALADILGHSYTSNEPLLRRAINAASRVGEQKEVDLLVSFVQRTDVSPVLRAEALQVLGIWANPSVMDRVDGRYRGKVTRENDYVISKLDPLLPDLLKADDQEVVVAASGAIGSLSLSNYTNELVSMVTDHPVVTVRTNAISVLDQLNYDDMINVVKSGLNDQDGEVRAKAMKYIDQLELDEANLLAIVESVFNNGSLQEQQQLLDVLNELPTEVTRSSLEQLIKRWIEDELHPGVSLDLIAAVDSTHSETLTAMIDPHRSTGNSAEDYSEVLYGGNARAGAQTFFNNPTAQCIRCHSWEQDPNAVGPYLRNIGNELTREQLLEALIEPGARLAPGYGTVSLTLSDGSQVSGTLLKENDHEIILKTTEAEPLEIPKQRIDKRNNFPSSMPAMGTMLSKREIRDLVEFLANLKAE